MAGKVVLVADGLLPKPAPPKCVFVIGTALDPIPPGKNSSGRHRPHVARPPGIALLGMADDATKYGVLERREAKNTPTGTLRRRAHVPGAMRQ
jgi:hypothetical protein